MEVAIVKANGSLDRHASTALVPWWSVTKSLIAVCILRLAEERRVVLDAPLPGRAYTLRQVLLHRAGIGEYYGVVAYRDAVARGDAAWPADALLARVPPDRLLFTPGIAFAYSNVGYLLLRRMIEDVTGRPLREALHNLVLGPLGLERVRLATTREDMDGTRFPGGHGYDPGWVYHGVVIGPVAEAALAMHRLLTGDLLAPQLRHAMQEAAPVGGVWPGRPWRTTGYGLGLMIGTMATEPAAAAFPVLGHSAGGPGSVGAVYHGPATGRTVAAFTVGDDEGMPESIACRLLATP